MNTINTINTINEGICIVCKIEFKKKRPSSVCCSTECGKKRAIQINADKDKIYAARKAYEKRNLTPRDGMY